MMERQREGEEEKGKRMPTGFTVADEDVPVLELGPTERRRREPNIEEGQSYDGDSWEEERRSVTSNSSSSRRARASHRAASFSLYKDFDEERLLETKKDKQGAVHVAELLVGVVANMNEFSDPSDYNNSSIFESFFDLTHARLLHIFQMFDDMSVEKDKGLLTYENFRQCLSDAGLEIKDKQSFDRLVKKVDLDMDGGISFAEFETVVQSLKMAHMFKSFSPKWETAFRCVNYNVKRAQVESIQGEAVKSFMYSPRPDWATHRWIEVFLPANFTLKCLSIKHRLHPLSLEDCLKDSAKARAKVERFDTHLFVVFPVLTLVYDDENSADTPMSPKSSGGFRRAGSLTRSGSTVLKSYGTIDVLEPLIRGKRSYAREKVTRTMSGNFQTVEAGLFEQTSAVTEAEEEDLNEFDISVPHVVKLNASFFVSRPDFKTAISVVTDDCRNLFHRVHRELEVSYSRLRSHDANYLLYVFLDVIVDSYQPLVAELESILTVLASRVRRHRHHIMSGVGEQAFSAAYHDMIREANNLKRWMIPAQRVVSNLIAEEDLDADCKLYLRDVHDHLEQTSDDINSLLDGLHALKEEYDHAIEVKASGTMYMLTIVATVALPGQFLSSVFGMNFTNMPELHWRYGYALFWMLTFSSWFFLYLFFRRKGYL